MQRGTRPTLANRVLRICNCSSPGSVIDNRQFAIQSWTRPQNPRVSESKSERSIACSRVFRRYLSPTHLSATSQHTSTAPEEKPPIPEYSFSVKPKSAKSPRVSQIRQSLRDWNDRNEIIKQQALPMSLPFEGKIASLPNALFIGQSQKIEESLDEELWDEEVYDNQLDNESIHYGGEAITPGTLMSYKSPVIKNQDVVYLGDIGTQSLMVLFDGRWAAEQMIQKRLSVSKFRSYPIQDFLTKEEVETLKAHMPKQDVTRALEEGTTPQPVSVTGVVPEEHFAPILMKFRAHNEAEQRFLRSHRSRLQQMYNSLSLENKWRIISLNEVALLTLDVEFDAMTEIAKKAFVKWTNIFHPLFVPAQTAKTLSYIVGPKSLSEDVKIVQDWARQYQEAAAQAALGKAVSNELNSNPLSSFINKARRIILKGRQIRSPTSMDIVGPTIYDGIRPSPRKTNIGEQFNSNDTKILNYLYDVAMRRPISHLPRAQASLIVRAIGAYPNRDLTAVTLRMLLQEMGCVEPWKVFEDFQLPLSGTKASWEIDELWHKAKESIVPLTDESSNTTTFPDSMASMRKDWGDLEAFCIDKFSTTNRDDALSIEPARDIPGGYWLHVHFAHPTAHLEVDHPVIQAARKRGLAYYSPIVGKKVQQMLPPEVIRQFSLAQGSPVLTVSTLLGENGQVHDVQVLPGTIRNVKQIDKDTVARLMNPHEEYEEAVLVVGKIPGPLNLVAAKDTTATQIPSQNLDDTLTFLPKLNLMQEILTARRKRRTVEVKTPARFRKTSFGLNIEVTLQEEKKKSDSEFEPCHWYGDPGIILRGKRKISVAGTFDEDRAGDIVAQSMRLASESLGKWLADRNIPAVFMGNESPTISIEELNRMISSTEIQIPMFLRTSSPRPYIPHNIQQHAACSSPLRRFVDTITHFQVDSYLKAEAMGLLSKGAPIGNDAVLAFSRIDVDDYLARDVSANDTLDDFTRETSKVWVTQALFRAFHFKEATLPDIMEMLVQKPARRNALGEVQLATGSLIPWGAKVELEPSPEGYENLAKFNEFLPIKLVSVNPALRAITARAIGPPTSEQMVLDPIECYSAENAYSPVEVESGL